MSALTGTWDATLTSPLGPISIVLEFSSTDDELHGTSTASGETIAVTKLTATPGEGSAVAASWGVDVTRPFPVHLDFTVTIDGDSLTGSATAGMLMPNGAVSGTRRS